jgi:hypothetical protein
MGNVPSVPEFPPHCNPDASDKLLEMDWWRKRWTAAEWSEYVAAGECQIDLSALRQCTHTGRPLGTSGFVAGLEQMTLRPLAARKGGRPKKPATDSREDGFAFIA